MTKTFGAAVRERRLELGMTLQEVADGIGVSISSISCVERDKRSPSVFLAQDIASYLGVDINTLLGIDKRKR